MTMNILEDIFDRSQYHPIIVRRKARYKIHDCVKQRKAKWKGALLSTQKMGKCLHKVFKAVVNEISKALPIIRESGSEVSYLIP